MSFHFVTFLANHKTINDEGSGCYAENFHDINEIHFQDKVISISLDKCLSDTPDFEFQLSRSAHFELSIKTVFTKIIL